jgi:FMN phosphatase YigB (HAD superfamily)
MHKSVIRSVIYRLAGTRPVEGPDDPRLAGGILTVDAFDTLITRCLFHPLDAFTICGIALRERLIIGLEPAAWRDLRHRVESDLARRFHPREVCQHEIYDELVGIGAITANNKNAARDIERAVEVSLSRPIAATIGIVNALVATRRTVTVLSDTCLSSGDLWQLLQAAGVDLPRNRVLTSSDTGKTKRSGALFRAIRSIFINNTEALLHVGDNFRADVYEAYRAGFRPMPYAAGAPSRFEKQLYTSLTTASLLGSVIAGGARAVRLGRRLPSRHEQTIWDVSANMSGLLLFAFVAWILREAAQRNLRTLYFFSRDGEILLRIARELMPTLAKPIDCQYLYVSRQSLHLPGVTDLGQPERDWMLGNPGPGSLSHLLERLDTDGEEFLRLLPAESPLHHINPHTRMTSDAMAAMSDALDTEAVKDLILERAASRRVACLDYLKGMNLLAPGPIGVVDIGWRASLQRSLCRTISTVEPHFAGRLHGFYLGLSNPYTDAGSLAEFSALCPNGDFSWAARGPLFEILCAAHHGTVTRYERGPDGMAAPVLASESNPEAQAWGVTVQQEAIVAFVREAVRGMEMARVDPLAHIESMAQAALDVVRMFVMRPSKPEAEVFGSFAHSSDEQHHDLEQVASRIDFRPTALVKRLSPQYRWRRISYWPEGSMVRSVPDWLCGPALSLLEAMPGRHT